MSNYVANYVFCNKELYYDFFNVEFDHRLFREGMYDPIGCILDEERRLVIFDTRGKQYKREYIENIISCYHDLVWNCVEENRIEEGQFYWDGEKVDLTVRPLEQSTVDCFFTIEFYDPDYKTFKLIIGFPDKIVEENFVINVRRVFSLSDYSSKQLLTYMNKIRTQILKEGNHGYLPATICGDILDEYCFWGPDVYTDQATICRCDTGQMDTKEFDKGESIIKEVKNYLSTFFKESGIDIKLSYKNVAEFTNN